MELLRDLAIMMVGFFRPQLRIAAVLIPAFVLFASVTASRGCSKEKAYLAAMKSDLRNLATVQEDRHSRHLMTGVVPDSAEYRSSTGVLIEEYRRVEGGFRAVAAYPEGTWKRCELRYSWGNEAVPTCDH